MPHTKRACYDRTRLYWLVYLCDHHCSLIHGRPPLTRDFHTLRRPRDFLQSYFTNPSDLSLISQVELWSISSRVFDIFGADIECKAASQRSDKLAQLSVNYNGWLEEWIAMLSFTNASVKFSRRVFDLYFHSAKLYLFSHIFRGSSQDTKPPKSGAECGSDTGTGEFAHGAVRSALAIIKCIVDDSESSSWLRKLPTYIGTMVAFACVCLVKVSVEQGPWLHDLQDEDIPSYLQRLVRVLLSSPVVNHPTHPLLSVARSLETATATAVTGGVHGQESLASIDIRDLDLDLGFFDMFTSEASNECPDSHGKTLECLARLRSVQYSFGLYIVLQPAPGLASYTLGQKTVISEHYAQIVQVPIYIVHNMTYWPRRRMKTGIHSVFLSILSISIIRYCFFTYSTMGSFKK
ncbi:hypothetical protein VN97_g1223 [Penicillium thymicola]|uniref:Uncharacterized protein n=1 Tax=Penicillium thymicola TaxID=293382 RepID=A0AAI9TRU1_PENTH|nr:hypothetical protein VN97_g1223 [Penicillium thymicola]